MGKEKKNVLSDAKEKLKKEKTSFFTEFKKFITRGNVLDLAVGVAVGGAFGKITSGLVNFIINPIIALLTGGISLEQWKTPLGEALTDETGALILDELGRKTYSNYIGWGEWIQTIIDFLIIAFSIFVALRVIRRAERVVRAGEFAKAEAEEKKKKAEEDAKNAAAAAEIERRKALEEEMFVNIRKQSELLAEISEKIKQ